MTIAMQWTKRFFKRLVLSEPQPSSPEGRPAEHETLAIQAGIGNVLCARCQHSMVRNPHQVRAGRARARKAARDTAGRFLANK
jgi:hypothetical protein